MKSTNINAVVIDIPVYDFIFPKVKTLKAITTKETILSKYIEIEKFLVEVLEYKEGNAYSLSSQNLSALQSLIDDFIKETEIQGVKTIQPAAGGNGFNKIVHMAPILKSCNFQLKAKVMGVLGSDKRGDFLLEILKNNNIELLNNTKKAQSTKTSFVISYNEDRIVAKSDYKMPIGLYDDEKYIVDSVKDAEVLILESKISRYGKEEIYNQILKEISDDLILVFNPNPASKEKFTPCQKQVAQRADIQAVNLEEFLKCYDNRVSSEGNEDIISLKSESLNDIISFVRENYMSKETDIIFITNGKEGSLAITKSLKVFFELSNFRDVNSEIRENTLGAGDAFASVIIAKYIEARKNSTDITEEYLSSIMQQGSNLATAVIKQPSTQLDQELVLEAISGDIPINGEVVEVSSGKKRKLSCRS